MFWEKAAECFVRLIQTVTWRQITNVCKHFGPLGVLVEWQVIRGIGESDGAEFSSWTPTRNIAVAWLITLTTTDKPPQDMQRQIYLQ